MKFGWQVAAHHPPKFKHQPWEAVPLWVGDLIATRVSSDQAMPRQ